MWKQNTTTFGLKVRARRGELGLSQRALATAVGVSQEWVSKIETGVTRAPRADTVVRLAVALRLDPTDLLAAFEPVPVPPAPPAPEPRDVDADRLRATVAAWLRIKARHDSRWSGRHATLLSHLARDAERSSLLVRLYAGAEPLPEASPRDDALTG